MDKQEFKELFSQFGIINCDDHSLEFNNNNECDLMSIYLSKQKGDIIRIYSNIKIVR